MKKSFMTRVLATGLSLAMALSLSTATNLVSAQAAPAMLVDAVSGESTSTLTVDVDTVAKLKINPEVSKTYKVESVKKSSKKIKTAVNKKGTVVYVRGMAATGEKDSAIRVYFKVKKTGKTAKRQFTAKVKVVAPKPAVAEITEAVQKETNKIAVKFSAAVDAKTTDIAIVREEGTITIPVKSVVLDADKLGASIVTYTDMKDAKVYNVTYTAADEAKTKSTVSFTATDAKVAQLTLSTSTVVANESTEVKVNTLDANGVALGSYKFSELAAQKITVDVKCATGGYKDGDKIFLKNVGDTATVEATLHTYQFENGVEKDTIKNADTTVTAVADSYAGITYNYTFTDKPATPAWDASTFKAVTTLPINENLYAHFNFKAGSTDKTSKFKIASADKSIVIIAEGAITKAGNYDIKGLKEGSTYLIVKDEKDNLVTTLPVTVQAARKATSLKLSTNAITVSNSNAQAVKWVEAKVYDQYDKEMTIDAGSVDFDKLTVASTCAVLAKSGNGVKVTGANMAKGTYYYQIKAKAGNVEVKNNLTVSVVDPTGSSSVAYALEVGSETVNLTKDPTSTSTTVANVIQTIKVQQLKNGALNAYVGTSSIASITISGTNGEGTVTVTSKGAANYGNTGYTGTATMAALVSTDSALKQEVKSGTYLVTAKIYTSHTTTATTDISTTFVVKNDTTARFGANVKETQSNKCSTVTVTGGDNIGSVISTTKNDMFAFTLDGVEIDNGKIKRVDWAASEKKVTGNEVYVGTVNITYEVKTGVVLYVPVTVNTTFTLND